MSSYLPSMKNIFICVEHSFDKIVPFWRLLEGLEIVSATLLRLSVFFSQGSLKS